MNIETVLIIGFIFVVMILFVIGMFMFPEMFGISKNTGPSDVSSEDKTLKK